MKSDDEGALSQGDAQQLCHVQLQSCSASIMFSLKTGVFLASVFFHPNVGARHDPELTKSVFYCDCSTMLGKMPPATHGKVYLQLSLPFNFSHTK